MQYIARDRDSEFTIEADHIVVREGSNVLFVKNGKAVAFLNTAWSVVPVE